MTMKVIYCHQNPGGSVTWADGTTKRPFTEVAEAIEAAGNERTRIYIEGFGRPFVSDPKCLVAIDGKSAVLEIRRWHGAGPAGYTVEKPAVYTGRPATFGAAHETYTNTYRLTGLSEKPSGVTCGYLTRLSPDGERMGGYQEVTSHASCDSTPGTWYWASGTLWVHAEDSSDLSVSSVINGHQIEYHVRGDGFRVRNSSNVRICDFEVLATFDDTQSFGCAFKIDGCSNVLVRNCRTYDSGYHHLVTPGGIADGIVWENVVMTGSSYSDDAYATFFANSGDVRRCRARGLVARMRPRLGWDHTPESPRAIANPSGSAQHHAAFAAHTGGTSKIAIDGVRYERCRAELVYPVGTFGAMRYQGISNGSECETPTDVRDPTQRALRYIECEFRGFTGFALGTTKGVSASMERCVLDCPGADVVSGAGGSNGLINLATSSGVVVDLLMVGCVVRGKLTGSNRSLLRIANNNILRLYNNTLIALEAGMSIVWRTGDQVVVGDGNVADVIGGSGLLFRTSSGTASGSNVSWTNGVYGTGFSTFGTGSVYDSKAEWTSAKDPAGRYDKDVAQVGEDCEPLLGSWVRENPIAPNRNMRRGVNRRPWSGHYGAHQFGDRLRVRHATPVAGIQRNAERLRARD